MKKTIVSLLGAATIVVMVAAPATDASAWWQRGWGWGPGIAAGVVGGAVIAGAIIASRPPGYVVPFRTGGGLIGPLSASFMTSLPQYETPKLARGDRRRNPGLRPRFCDTETGPRTAHAPCSRVFLH
jgi:hypothetical protein